MFSIKRTLKSFFCCALVATLFSSFTVSAVNVTDLNNNSPILTISNENERYIGGAAIGYSYFVVAQNDITKESYVYMSNEYKEDWTKEKININTNIRILDIALYAGRYYILAEEGSLVIYSSNNLTNWEKVFDTEIKAKNAELVAGEMNLLLKVAAQNNDIIYRLHPESHLIEEIFKFKDHAEALIFYKNMFMAASKNYFYLISDYSKFETLVSPVSEIIGTKIDEIIAYQPMETQCNRSSMYLMYKLNGQTYTKQIHTSVTKLGWEPIRDTVEYNEELVKNYTSYTDVVGLWGYPILVINDDYFYVTKMKSNAIPLKCDEKKVEWAFHYDIPSDWAATQVRLSAQELVLTPATTPREYTANITREDFAKYVYNLLKNYLIFDGKKIENPFTDTNCEEVIKLRRLGIIKGTSETTFSPDKKLTRAEAATMLMRIHEKYGKFTGDIVYDEFVDDDEIPSWARDAVYYVKTMRIMSGYNGNIFGPNDPYTYEQSLVTLARMSEIVWEGDPPVCTTCIDQGEENHEH